MRYTKRENCKIYAVTSSLVGIQPGRSLPAAWPLVSMQRRQEAGYHQRAVWGCWPAHAQFFGFAIILGSRFAKQFSNKINYYFLVQEIVRSTPYNGYNSWIPKLEKWSLITFSRGCKIQTNIFHCFFFFLILSCCSFFLPGPQRHKALSVMDILNIFIILI